MILDIFSIYDTVAKFHRSSYSLNFDRYRSDLVDFLSDPANSKADLLRFPSQYQLFKIGTFDNCSGAYTSLKEFESFGLISDFLSDTIGKAHD